MSNPVVGSVHQCKCGRKILVEQVINGSNHTLGIIVCCWDCLDAEGKGYAAVNYGIPEIEEVDVKEISELTNEQLLTRAAEEAVGFMLLEVQRECIAIRKAGKSLLALIDHKTELPDSALNGVMDPTGTVDEGVVKAQEIITEARRAIDV